MPKPPEAWQIAGIRSAFGDYHEPFVEPSRAVECEALKLCAERGWGAVLDPQEVGAYLHSKDHSVQLAALEVLGQLGEEAGRFAREIALLAATRDRPDLADPANDALRRMGAAQIAPLLKDEDAEVRNTGVTILGAMGPKAAAFAKEVAGLLKDDLGGLRVAATVALGQMGKEGAAFAAQVAPLLKDPNITIRFYAAVTLGQMGADAAAFAPDVAALLADEDSRLRGVAAGSLAKMGEPGAAFSGDIAALLKDPNANVRRSALAALKGMGKADSDFAKEIAALLKDSDASVRRAALSALKAMGKDSAVFANEIAALLKDPNPWVRGEAATTLAGMGKTGAAFAADLIAALPDCGHLGNSAISGRSAVINALHQMAKNGTPVITDLAALLKSNNPAARGTAIEALGQMSPEGAAYAGDVAAFLKDPDASVRRAAAEALGKMDAPGAAFAREVAALLKDPDASVRAASADALGAMGPAAAQFAGDLLTLLGDRTCPGSSEVVQALGQMGKAGVPVAGGVAALLKDHNPSVRSSANAALGQMGPARAPFARDFAALLNDPDVYVRRAAVFILGEIGEPAAAFAPEIHGLLRDEDALVRLLAAVALGKIPRPGSTLPAGPDAARQAPDPAAPGLGPLPTEGALAVPRLLPLPLRPGCLRCAAPPPLSSTSSETPPPISSYRRLSSPPCMPRPPIKCLRCAPISASGPAEMPRSSAWSPGWANPRAIRCPRKASPLLKPRKHSRCFFAFWDHTTNRPALREELTHRISQVTKAITGIPDAATAKILQDLAAKPKAPARGHRGHTRFRCPARSHRRRPGRRSRFVHPPGDIHVLFNAATQLLEEVRLLDSAIDQCAIENGLQAGTIVPPLTLQQYLKKDTSRFGGRPADRMARGISSSGSLTACSKWIPFAPTISPGHDRRLQGDSSRQDTGDRTPPLPRLRHPPGSEPTAGPTGPPLIFSAS